MSWITNFDLPKVDKSQAKEGAPELWKACGACHKMLFLKSLSEEMWVCHHCGCHMRIPARVRLGILFDEGQYDTITLPSVTDDPLNFKDVKKYSDRLKAARAHTKLDDALMVGVGTIRKYKAVVCAMDFFFMGGSMGRAVGEGFLLAVKHAVEHKLPFVMVTASGGARMQEGVLSLMQMVRTTVGVQMLREHALPFINILSDPTTGGVFASYGMLGDFTFAEPKAFLALSGTRVLSGTTAEKLPPGFQRSEYVLERGMIDGIVSRQEQAVTIANVISVWKKDGIRSDASNESAGL